MEFSNEVFWFRFNFSNKNGGSTSKKYEGIIDYSFAVLLYDFFLVDEIFDYAVNER